MNAREDFELLSLTKYKANEKLLSGDYGPEAPHQLCT